MSSWICQPWRRTWGLFTALRPLSGWIIKLVEENGRKGVEITAIEKDWGPNYLQFGLALQDNLEGDAGYAIGASYTRTAMNSLGGRVAARGADRRVPAPVYRMAPAAGLRLTLLHRPASGVPAFELQTVRLRQRRGAATGSPAGRWVWRPDVSLEPGESCGLVC